MKRSVPLKSRTGLRTRTPLQRRKPLAAVSPKRAGTTAKPVRREPAVPVDVRAELRGRSDGWCEIQRPGCWGRATDSAHRIGTKRGGRHGAAAERHARLSNVLAACRSCHEWCHAHPAQAKAAGLMLEEWQMPTQEPVLYRGRVVYLGDAGEIADHEAVGT